MPQPRETSDDPTSANFFIERQPAQQILNARIVGKRSIAEGIIALAARCIATPAINTKPATPKSHTSATR